MNIFYFPRRSLLAACLSLLSGWAGLQTRADGPASSPASQPTTQPARPTAEQIRKAVRELSHPVHVRRRAAIRQFAEWGPMAFPELRRVISSSDHEAALSARDLLAELQSAILIGAQIRLELDRTRAAWNEPIALVVHASNPSSDPIVVPWAATKAPATQPAAIDAQQVGALLDAADFLVVTGPTGETLDPRVDPIEREPLVYSAVNARAHGTPPSHPMAAGATDDLRIPLFNRGWARYATLAPGKYTIAFAYQPDWSDESWTKDGFGLVKSEPVTLEITEPAPEAIQSATVPLAMKVREEASNYIAELECTWDRALSVNLNWGDIDETHALLEWRIEPKDDKAQDEPVRWIPEGGGKPYKAAEVRSLKPGERLIIGRAPKSALAAKARLIAPDSNAAVNITARYVHLPNPAQIRQALEEQSNDAPVPRDLFSGTVTSEPESMELR